MCMLPSRSSKTDGRMNDRTAVRDIEKITATEKHDPCAERDVQAGGSTSG